jgi:ATP-binding cassette subfamily B protein
MRKFLGIDEMTASFRRLLPYVMKYRTLYVALLFLMLADIGLTLLFAWLLSGVADAAVAGDITRISWLMLCGAGMIVLRFLADYFENVLQADAINRVRKDLQIALFTHLLRLPARFFTERHSGDLVARLTQDAYGVEGAVGTNLLYLIRMPLLALTALIYLLFLHWQMALLCLFIAPAALLIGALFGTKVRDNGRQLQQQLGKVNALLHDVFSGFIVMRTFALERKLANKYDSLASDILQMERKEARLIGTLQAGSGTLSLIAFYASLGLGAYYVANGKLTIGSMFAFVTLMQYMAYPFSGIARQWGGLQRSLASIERIWMVMDEQPDHTRSPSYLASRPLHTGISLDGLTFSYETGKNVISRMDLFIPAGSTAAIVGPSGAGKSTLFRLLAGLHPPTGGAVLFDRHRLTATDPDLWRSYLAYVPQEPYLFADTIRENIADGRPDATDSEIEHVARMANAHEFIMELPQGYATEIRERGGDLSGGQKQRITIARALLKDAPILLLDEATSSLDAATEESVKEALQRLKKGRTTLMIAHRLSTVREADQILVMDKGTIIEQGTHDQLLEQAGWYAQRFERR